MSLCDVKIAVIGLGYVGLPLARLFSTKFKTIGFDLNKQRVQQLMSGYDSTLEVSEELLQNAINEHDLICTCDVDEIKKKPIFMLWQYPLLWTKTTILTCALFTEQVQLLARLSRKVILWFTNPQFILV